LDVLIDMYKADRPTGTAGSDDTSPLPLTMTSSSSKLLHRSPLSLRPDPGDVTQRSDVVNSATSPLQTTVAESLRPCRPLRPMLRNLSDLGPRVTCRATPPCPPVSVMLTSSVSPTTDECVTSVNIEESPTGSSSSSRRYPSIIRESDDEADRQHFPSPHEDDNNGDVIKLLPLPVADDDDPRANHVSPQQFVDNVSSSSNVIGRTVSPEDSSHSVIELPSLLES